MKGILAALVLAAPASAVLGQTVPTTKVLTCTTSGCHAKEMDHQFLHGPAAVSACDACHEYADPVTHAFNLKRPGRQLCDFCHIDKTGTEGPFVHKPVADGDCTGCHDPHGASTRRMLKAATTPELCASCHKEVLTGKHVHKPAGENCAECHLPHTASHAMLLTMDARSLCLRCHADVGSEITASAHPHDPAQGDCLQCHKPHASDEVQALKMSPKDLCISCHEPVGKAIAEATHPHSATTDARACLNCHTAHASEHVKQLFKDPVGACLECHQKPIVTEAKRTIAAVAEVGVDALHRHGSIAEGDCATCHTVHAGQFEKLLVQAHDPAFYQQYSGTSYGLCFSCHDRALVDSEPAGPQTGFRDGGRNLHATHVKRGARGQSCGSCHATHASRFETMMADSVAFGQWQLPINFTKTAAGGSCAPGCHKPQTYDRGAPTTPAAPKP